MRTMKAVIFKGFDDLELQEVPVPDIDENSALLKVRACAICGSDLRIIKSGHPMVKPPQILGHEISGDIVAVGANVTKVKLGDRVAVGADIPCGECENCEAELGNFCYHLNGIGHTFAGGFAEYCLLHPIVLRNGPVHAIPDSMSYQEGAIAEPLGCILNGMQRIKPKLNDTAVIMGAGPVGCMMIPILYKYGCARVIMTDPVPARIELAKRFHADRYVVSSQENAVDAVLQETQGKGADIIITANPAPQSHIDAIGIAAIHGTVCIFGGLPSGVTVNSFNTNAIHYKELTVLGAHGSRPIHHRMAIDMIAAGKIDIDPIVTHTFDLDHFPQALHVARSQDGLKVVITMEGV